DRFGLSVEVRSPQDVAERIEVIRRRDAYERKPEAFVKRFAAQDAGTRAAILDARARLDKVRAGDKILGDCAELCLALGSDGLRGELTLLRAARALAAFEGAKSVSRKHLKRIAPLALSHRLRRDPLDEAGSSTRVSRTVETVLA
ncbi:MAG: magnesium chelatase ATPase subunit I, partial [Pseudomonadota bacterium]